MTGPHKIEVTLKVDDQSVDFLGRIQRTQLLRIVREAVSNVVRHARASLLMVEIYRHGQECTLVVRDNGDGFDLLRVERGHGLINLNARTADLGRSLRDRFRPGPRNHRTADLPRDAARSRGHAPRWKLGARGLSQGAHKPVAIAVQGAFRWRTNFPPCPALSSKTPSPPPRPRMPCCCKAGVRTRRDAKAFSFIEVNDGSCLKGIQVIADSALPCYAAETGRTQTGGLHRGAWGVRSPPKARGSNGKWWPRKFRIVGEADATSAAQKKGHSLEFLREIAHLRPRSNLFGAVFRVRSRLAFAIHQYFQSRSFHYVHTPIITASDCEGAGELFRVTTLDPSHPPMTEEGDVDFKKDFFGKKSYLTVSGQLEGEIFACALGNIYTFGPTFRAENSNTSRHAAEFWMIEPGDGVLRPRRQHGAGGGFCEMPDPRCP
jgi:hypothetical protein